MEFNAGWPHHMTHLHVPFYINLCGLSMLVCIIFLVSPGAQIDGKLFRSNTMAFSPFQPGQGSAENNRWPLILHLSFYHKKPMAYDCVLSFFPS